MTSPIALGLGIAADVTKGVVGAEAAQVQAAGQQLNIIGEMQKTIATAFGQEVQAQQYDYQSKIMDYQAAVADQNEKIALQNQDYEKNITTDKQWQKGAEWRATRAATVAAQGSSGINVNSTSSVDVRQSMIELGTYDQMQIQSEGMRKAYAFGVEANQAKAQADLYRYSSAMDVVQAANTRTAVGMTMQALPLQQQAYNLAGTAGTLGAMASIAGAAGSVASKWMDATKIGMV